jgi:hypothetical protein
MSDLTGIALLRTVIPDEFANQLVLISINWRKDKFAIGDIRNSLKAMVEERLLPIAAPDIDDFLAECLNHEIEPRTIRYYALIAGAFGEPAREQFSYLPFSHFAFAQSLGDEKAVEALQMAKDKTENSGKVPSVAWLRSALNGYIYEQNSRMYNDDLGNAKPYIEDDLGGAPEPGMDEPKVEGWLSGLRRAVEFSIKHLDAAPLDSELKSKLLDLLCQVDTLLGQAVVV